MYDIFDVSHSTYLHSKALYRSDSMHLVGFRYVCHVYRRHDSGALHRPYDGVAPGTDDVDDEVVATADPTDDDDDDDVQTNATISEHYS